MLSSYLIKNKREEAGTVVLSINPSILSSIEACPLLIRPEKEITFLAT
jgi:hypothetical protein